VLAQRSGQIQLQVGVKRVEQHILGGEIAEQRAFGHACATGNRRSGRTQPLRSHDVGGRFKQGDAFFFAAGRAMGGESEHTHFMRGWRAARQALLRRWLAAVAAMWQPADADCAGALRHLAK
jgi:hypothetical protein